MSQGGGRAAAGDGPDFHLSLKDGVIMTGRGLSGLAAEADAGSGGAGLLLTLKNFPAGEWAGPVQVDKESKACLDGGDFSGQILAVEGEPGFQAQAVA